LKDYEREAALAKIRKEEAAKAACKAIKDGVAVPNSDDVTDPEEPRPPALFNQRGDVRVFGRSPGR